MNGSNIDYPKFDTKEKKIIFFGNSITQSWSDYTKFFSDNGYLNKGISGQTTDQMLVRFKKDIVDENGLFWNIWARGYCFIKQNDIENTYIIIHKMKNYKNKDIDIEYAICQLYFMIGDIDKGYEWYQKYSDKFNHNIEIIYDLPFENFRQDSRYKNILKEMKLLKYWD